MAIGRAGDRDVIVSGSDDGTVRIWDASHRGGERRPVDGPRRRGDRGGDRAGRGPERRRLRSGGRHRADLERVTAEPVAILRSQSDRVTAVATGRAGDRYVVVTGDNDGRALMWDAVTGSPAAVLGHHDGWVHAVTIGPAGDRDVIAATWPDKTGRAWDAVTGDPLPAAWATGLDDWLTGEDDKPREMAVAIGRAGPHDVIAVGGPGLAPVRLYNAVTGEDRGGPLTDHESWMTTMAIGRAAGRDIIAFVSNRTIEIWDAVSGWPVGGWRTGHEGQVTAVAIGHAGGRGIVVSSSLDGSVRIWDVIDRRPADRP